MPALHHMWQNGLCGCIVYVPLYLQFAADDSSDSDDEYEKQEASVRKLQKHFPDLDKEVSSSAAVRVYVFSTPL